MFGSLITWRPRKTRKPHVCFGCGDEYPAGAQMVYARYGADVLYSVYWCPTCAESVSREAEAKKEDKQDG